MVKLFKEEDSILLLLKKTQYVNETYNLDPPSPPMRKIEVDG